MKIENEIAGQYVEEVTSEEVVIEEEIDQNIPFPVDCLPPVLENMARGISDIAGVPVEMAAPLVLAIASASTGRAVLVDSIQNHQTGSNLFLLFSKQSGSGGSTAFKLASAPFMGREAQLRRDFEDNDKPGAEAERDAAQSDIDRCKSELKSNKCEDKGAVIENIKDARKRLNEAEKRMIAPLLAMSDSTPEGAAKILSEQGECLFHADADASDAIKSAMGGYQEGNGPSESLWLKAYTGDPVTITRRNSVTVKLERPTLALCWIMTPDSMRSLFQKDRLSEGGFLARCLVANVPGSARPIPINHADQARKIPSEISQPYEAAIWSAINTYRLSEMNDGPVTIGMTEPARLEFINDWNKMVELTDGKPDQFISRHTEQSIRIALVLHLFNNIEFEKRGDNTFGIMGDGLAGHTRPMDVHGARAGIKIHRWFADQQTKLLAPQKAVAEDALLEKVQNKLRTRPGGICRRDITGGIFKTAKEAQQALDRWASSGALIKIEQPKRKGPGAPPPPIYKNAPFSS